MYFSSQRSPVVGGVLAELCTILILTHVSQLDCEHAARPAAAWQHSSENSFRERCSRSNRYLAQAFPRLPWNPFAWASDSLMYSPFFVFP